MTMISMEGIASAWTARGTRAVQRLFFDRQAEFWLGELDPRGARRARHPMDLARGRLMRRFPAH
jgi:hypothetical protein